MFCPSTSNMTTTFSRMSRCTCGPPAIARLIRFAKMIGITHTGACLIANATIATARRHRCPLNNIHNVLNGEFA